MGGIRCSRSLFRFPASPLVGHREQRETPSIRGAPRWTETPTHARVCVRAHAVTHSHALSHSHVICYPICTVTKPPLTPGPSEDCTHTHTHKHTHTYSMYKHTHSRTATHNMRLRACAHTLWRCSRLCNWRWR